jgi:hypothetical protein
MVGRNKSKFILAFAFVIACSTILLVATRRSDTLENWDGPPVYPDARNIVIEKSNLPNYESLYFETDDSFLQVQAFYSKILVQEGWRLDTTPTDTPNRYQYYRASQHFPQQNEKLTIVFWGTKPLGMDLELDIPIQSTQTASDK